MLGFDYEFHKDAEETVITVTKCNLVVALYLMKRCVDKFGNWSHGTKVELFGPNQLINQTVGFRITIPAYRDRMRDPWTKEYIDGYFSCLKEICPGEIRKELLAKALGLGQ